MGALVDHLNFITVIWTGAQSKINEIYYLLFKDLGLLNKKNNNTGFDSGIFYQ